MGDEDGETADRAMFYSDCPASYLASQDRIEKKKKICSVIYTKTGQIKFYYSLMSNRESKESVLSR